MRAWEQYLQTHRERHLAELMGFLTIPSVSINRNAIDQAAGWVTKRLVSAGMEHVSYDYPVVYADWLHAPGRPTVLIYGHFDVEPAGDESRWSSPPFQPRLTPNGRIFARGASDDKGNLQLPILAVEAILRTTKRLPVNVKFCLEAQEEIGSPDLPAWLAANRERLACDLVISADGGQWGEDQPALTVGTRGLCALQIYVCGPERDLHSGVYGGTVQNPIHALARLLASFHHPDGRVAVAGFYNDVADERLEHEPPGMEPREPFGEPGWTTLERSWLRPTLEVNGIWGGSEAAIVPAEARAAVTCRLVPGQEPERILDLIEEHVRQHTPASARATLKRLSGMARPYRIPVAHPANRAAAQVLARLYGKTPITVMMGASIPVCALFRAELGVETLLFGFGLDDENIHGPDEFFRLSSWDRGQRAYALLLERLATAW